jgi:hypothetical protein
MEATSILTLKKVGIRIGKLGKKVVIALVMAQMEQFVRVTTK